MRKSKNGRNNAGFTLMELMIASGVMVVGMVLMMQSVINISHQSKITDIKIAASHFSHSILESMIEKEASELLQFNSDREEFELTSDNTLILGSVGEVTVNIYALIPDGATGNTSRVSLPVPDANLAAVTADVSNPVEIQIEILKNTGGDEGSEYKFYTSCLVYTL